MAAQFLVITFTGPDRPGIVSRLSSVVRDHGGNWEASRMAALAGRFAGILQVEIDEGRAEGLVEALDRLDDLEVMVDWGTDAPRGARRFSLSLTGHDRPGIVREVSQALAAHGASLLELETRTIEAPMVGGLLFEAEAELTAPAEVGIETLRLALERIAADLMVEILLTD